MKKYELSLSRNYVSSWGIKEAIRELLQNAKDSCGDEQIGIDKSTGIITITNKNITIPSSTLLLGNTSKKDDLDKIGQFGEGYKLAILVLLREGKDITIRNGNKLWIPSFQYSNNFECEVLCIDEIENNGNDLEFIISPFSSVELEELENEFLGLNSQQYNSIKTSYGEILTDSEYKGKIFVEGLPVYEDDNFNYGYNFEARYVTLDRDRKSINIYELKKLTALSVACCTNNFAFIDEAIEGKGKDSEYIIDQNISFTNEFKEKYAKHLKERFNIKDNDIVVNESSSELIKELERKPDSEVKTVKYKVYADIINETLDYSSEMIKQVNEAQRKRDEIDDAWYEYEYSDYKKFKEWFDEFGNQLNNQAQDQFKVIIETLEPDGFELIKEEVWNDK